MNFNSREAVNNLDYNTSKKALVIPEYGRHMQSLIDHVCKIEDREERNKAARYVISVMGSMNPHLRDVPDFQHKLWDQLFMMSKFELDVDSPFPIATQETIFSKPEKLAYPQNHPKYRFYGNNITYMINKAIAWEDGEMKDALIMVIANHMKKSYLSWNKETVKDEVIFEHLCELSNGKINLFKKEEELSTTANLIQVNKKQSNKANFTSNQKNASTNSNNNNNKKFKTNNNYHSKGKK
ncbi:DUF4290 domain-containing protein [Myroides phaeus]|uniref:DUF4290 domain-containing protein n=1 Tax=Myroides phaeus TaxID=702745 RepID=UPI001302F684|nr:DUF4290 domain-containing protein [Myroides phaeus]